MTGVAAIEGFDYQAMVVLELSLEFFERQSDGRVRPEGRDDADLIDPDSPDVVHVQIKKPSQSSDGTRTYATWTVPAAAVALFPAALARLQHGRTRQRWILGDTVDAGLEELVKAGIDAPRTASTAYLRALHFLTLERAGIGDQLRRRPSCPPRRTSRRWSQALLES